MMTEDEKFTEYLHEVLEDMPAVPEPPREAMWARIDEERRVRRGQAARFRLRGSRLAWGIGLAAMLALGIGLGRASLGGDAGRPAPTASGPAADDPALLPYRLAARQHLTRSEALLTAYVRDVQAGRTQEVARWAQDLLTNTRLLRDSPAAQDPETAKLLDDLELHLAQIANLSGSASGELEMIQDGIERNNMLLRLRALTASNPAGI
jgi:hypothetical protein